MEVPNLSSSSILSLDDHVSVVNEIKILVRCHLVDNVEISFDIETEILVEFTLLWLRVFINIDDFPLLSDILAGVSNHDVSVFCIGIQILVLNLKNLSFFISDKTSLSSPHLPPS
jgi:hypothetical protein